MRNLLTSTVGKDEQQLLGHRTEPVVVDVFVDEIMVDLWMWKAYDDAQQELTRRYAGCTSATTAESSEMPTPTVEQEQRLDELAELEARLDNQHLRDGSCRPARASSMPPTLAAAPARGTLPAWFDCDTEDDLTRARGSA